MWIGLQEFSKFLLKTKIFIKKKWLKTIQYPKVYFCHLMNTYFRFRSRRLKVINRFLQE